ncbi:ead/Ea22-like family protein [Enterobacter hormaechei]
MSNIDKQALRVAAEKATKGKRELWDSKELSLGLHAIPVAIPSQMNVLCHVLGSSNPMMDSYTGVSRFKNEAEFIAAANPETVLALLDELEESDRLRLKFQEANCELCQKLEVAEKTSAARLGAIDTTHKMFQRERDRAEKAEKQIAGYQELISSLVGISSSILREVERINNAAAAGKGE